MVLFGFVNLLQDLVDMPAVFHGFILDKREFRGPPDVEPLAQLGADISPGPVQGPQSGIIAGLFAEERAVNRGIAVVIGNFHIRYGHKADIRIFQIKLNDIRNVLADDSFQTLLLDAAHAQASAGTSCSWYASMMSPTFRSL